MKKFVILLAVAVCSLLGYGQTNQMIWHNGRMQYAQSITNVDSLTFPGVVSESDTLQFILPRAIIIHDTIIVTRIDTVYIHDGGTADALTGAFSVSADKQVRFSKGNLRYVQSTKTWSFADEQYDIIGEANVKDNALADTIDLFGRSSDNAETPFGVSISTDASKYTGNFVDWGKNIGDGNTWRTLSEDEWLYLLETRTNASSLYGATCLYLTDDSTQYVNGLIVLPDNWTCPTGITFKTGVMDLGDMDLGDMDNQQNGNDYKLTYADFQTLTLKQWKRLEDSGAVFLPASYRIGTKVSYDWEGVYWCSDFCTTNRAYSPTFSAAEIGASFMSPCSNGNAVRLVKDL